MTERCADLDEFFDGELAADQAARFCDHLATCERCQDVLHGRMQERVITQIRAVPEPAAAPEEAAPAEPPAPVVSATAAPAAACAAVPRGPARIQIVGRVMAYASPLLAAAAAYALWFGNPGVPELAMKVAVDRAPVTDRAVADRVRVTDRTDRAEVPPHTLTVNVGDVVRPTVQGPGHRAICVYAGERSLIAACPGAARCHDGDGELSLELALTTRGKYVIIALGSSDPLPAPGATLDQTRAAARRAGIRTVLRYVEVE